MAIVADTHAHIYPCYSRARALAAAARNMGELAQKLAVPAAPRALLLVERADCRFFDTLEAPRGAARVEVPGRGELWIFPGQQAVTRERIEVLSLACGPRVAEGMTLRDTIAAISDEGGLPVLCWAFGKWTGARGRLVREALEDRAIRLFMGDSSLRATGASLFPVERRVLAGSDPLPFAGEEEQLGRYGVKLDADIDEQRPLESMREALQGAPLSIVGKRCSFLEAAYRISRNELRRRAQRFTTSFTAK